MRSLPNRINAKDHTTDRMLLEFEIGEDGKMRNTRIADRLPLKKDSGET
jgi:hypothetical protein